MLCTIRVRQVRPHTRAMTCVEQVKRVFALARPGLLEGIQPEIQALFRAVIYAFSIWVNKQTPGNVFMNLLFVNGRSSTKSLPPRCVLSECVTLP